MEPKVNVLEKDIAWRLVEVENHNRVLELPISDEQPVNRCCGLIIDYTQASSKEPNIVLLGSHGSLYPFHFQKDNIAERPAQNPVPVIVIKKQEAHVLRRKSSSSSEKVPVTPEKRRTKSVFVGGPVDINSSPRSSGTISTSSSTNSSPKNSNSNSTNSSPSNRNSINGAPFIEALKRRNSDHTNPALPPVSPDKNEKINRRRSLTVSGAPLKEILRRSGLSISKLSPKPRSPVPKFTESDEIKVDSSPKKENANVTTRTSPMKTKDESKSLQTTIPAEFLCPITLQIMVDPVFADDGHIYEREAIMKWLHVHDCSPLDSSIIFSHKQVISNKILKNTIAEYLKNNTHLLNVYFPSSLKDQIYSAVTDANREVMKLLIEKDQRLLLPLMEMVFATPSSNHQLPSETLSELLQFLLQTYSEDLHYYAQMKCGNLIQSEGAVACYVKSARYVHAKLMVQYLVLTKENVKNIVRESILQKDCSMLEGMFKLVWKPNEVLDHGGTILHRIASNGSIPLAQVALRYGASINYVDTDGNTPLHFAAKDGQMNMFSFLAEQNGCSLSLVNRQGKTAADMAQTDEIRQFCTEIIQYQPAKKYMQKMKQEILDVVMDLKKENAELRTYIEEQLAIRHEKPCSICLKGTSNSISTME
jgi:hypothetical protein